MFFRRLCVFSFFLLTACGEQGGSFDARKYLEEMKGPDVGGVEKTTLDAAKQAESVREFDRAASYYQQLADKYPANKAYVVGEAEALRRGGKNDEALRKYDAVLSTEPENIDALEGKMLATLAKGEQQEAATLVEKILSLDKNRWRTLNAGGILFAGRGMVDESMQYYEQALRVQPDSRPVLNNVGLTLALDKRYDKAIQSLTRASALAPAGDEKKQLDLNLALVYGISGDMQNAERVAGKYYQGAQLYNNLGYYAYLNKDNSLARDYLNMALTKSPTSYDRAWQNLEDISSKNDTKKPKTKVTPEKRVEVPLVKEPQKAAVILDTVDEPKVDEAKPVEKKDAAKDEKKSDEKKADVKKAEEKKKDTKKEDVKKTDAKKEADDKKEEAKKPETAVKKKPTENPDLED